MGLPEPKTKCLVLVVNGCLQASSKRHHQQGNSFNDIKDEQIIFSHCTTELLSRVTMSILLACFRIIFCFVVANSYMYDLVHDMKAIHGNLF